MGQLRHVESPCVDLVDLAEHVPWGSGESDLALLQHRGVAAWMAANVSSRQPLSLHENGSGREERGAEPTLEAPRRRLAMIARRMRRAFRIAMAPVAPWFR